MSLQYLSWRKFGAHEVANGHIPLWNPYIYSGSPFLSNLQSELLYPPNIIFLILPLAMAINYSVFLHVFLAGIFMYLWANSKKLHPMASILAAVLFMFSSTHFLRIYGGHLANLCTITWFPLLLLAVDGIVEKPSIKWVFLGIFSITMEILAGYVQYIFYFSVILFIYSFYFTVKQREIKIFIYFILMYVGSFLLSSSQLLPTFASSGETIRNMPMEYDFISSFSFPPENLITLICPDFFGDAVRFPYWGRWELWEMSLFISVTGFCLVIYGVIYSNLKYKKIYIYIIIFLLILAMGLPFFKFIYMLPGFNRFRCPAKFIFPASLYLIILSASGFDYFLRNGKINKFIITIPAFSGAILGFLSLYLKHMAVNINSYGLLTEIFKFFALLPGRQYPSAYYENTDFILQASFWSSKSLMFSSIILIFLSLLFFFGRKYKKVMYFVGFLAIMEIFFFARASIITFNLDAPYFLDFQKFAENNPGDYRVFNVGDSNLGMYAGMYDIWGYDTLMVLKRYSEFMAFTQGQNVDKAGFSLNFNRIHPLFSMLRCRYVIYGNSNERKMTEIKDPMKRLYLIDDFKVIKDRDNIFKEMDKKDFEPRKTVILEDIPEPLPVKSSDKGQVKILSETTDNIVIEGDLNEPSILVITDSYSRDWHVISLKGSSQTKYTVMPGNYILRAIPLSKGHHLFNLKYMPRGFMAGKWISIISLIFYVIFLVFFFKKYRVKSEK